jgi:pyruvate formate lyase activating enzyme
MLRYRVSSQLKDGRCRGCGRVSPLISGTLGACADCIRSDPKRVQPGIRQAHTRSRRAFGLPARPPRATDGTPCIFCVNECRIPEGGRGYCGLRTSRGGKLVHLGGTRRLGILQWYYDPLPTNCVAQWACAESTHCGFKNLAVFYGSCSFNCLYCQNWSYRHLAASLTPGLSAEGLAQEVDEKTACICFFGGDPSPQMPHAIATAELARKKAGSRSLRLCWETNGSLHPALLRRAAGLALDSGGTIKFDLKAWDDNLQQALCGITNRRTLEDFRWLAAFGRQRPEPPLVVASTLLVPGYVDVEEVAPLARFIAAIDPAIPYSLLAFHPQFYLVDLPTTSRSHALRCLKAARESGLTNVRIGNIHLLSEAY